MAKFNNEIITDDEKVREIAMKECGMYLQSCLSAWELEDLKEDWKEAGGYEAIPWWKFAFDNIKVSYKQEDLGMEKNLNKEIGYTTRN